MGAECFEGRRLRDPRVYRSGDREGLEYRIASKTPCDFGGHTLWILQLSDGVRGRALAERYPGPWLAASHSGGHLYNLPCLI